MTQIIEQERRIHQAEPAHPDRKHPKVSQVGIHRFAAGHDEHQRAEHQERLVDSDATEKQQTMYGIECLQDLGVVRDLMEAKAGQHDEPDDQNRTKYPADAGRALELHGKERGEQDCRQRDHGTGEPRCCDAKSLDGGEHADRRRDHTVAKQQPRPEHQRPEEYHHPTSLVAMKQAVERKYAPFAVIFSAQHENGVLNGDDDRDRPDDEGDAAEHVFVTQRDTAVAQEDLVEGVEGRRADVAVNDSCRGDRQCRGAAAGRMGSCAAVDHNRTRRISVRRRPASVPRPSDTSRLISRWIFTGSIGTVQIQ